MTTRPATVEQQRDPDALRRVEEARAALERGVYAWATDGDIALRAASVTAMQALFAVRPCDIDVGAEAAAEGAQVEITYRLAAALELIKTALRVDQVDNGSPLSSQTLFDLAQAIRAAALAQLWVEIHHGSAPPDREA